MQWEVPLLLGFIILFGFWATTPEQFYHTDFMGIKHYIMTPAVTEEQNDLNELTNVLFLKYRDPWKIFTGIMILVAGIFVGLSQREQIQTFLQDKSRTLSKFSNPVFIHLSQNKRFVNQNNSHPMLLQKKHVLKSSLKFRPSFFKVFVIFFSFLLLGPIVSSSNAFAADTPVSVADVISDNFESTTVTDVDSTNSTSFDIPAFEDNAVVGSGVAATDTVTFDADSAVVQVQGNVIINPSDVTTFDADSATITYTLAAATSTITIQSSVPTIVVGVGSSLSTVTVPSGISGAIDFSDADGTLTTSGQDVTITTQDTVPVTIQIQTSTTISDTDGNGETWNGVFQTASVQSTSSVSAPSGQVVDLVLSAGSPTNDLTLDKAMKFTLNGQAGKTVSFESSTGVQTEITATCDSTDPATVTLGAGADCKINDGANLIVLTRHLTDIFTSSPSTGGSGGGSGGDNTPPSVTVGFDQNEFPLKYAGVNYQTHQLDTIHTAIIETGEELQTTLSVYENQGAGNIQHVELYVNHFGSQILNDLTETVIIYDEQSGLEIVDPHDLIATADVIPSISGNKAAFDFVVVFKDEIPQSDVLFRLWDIKRNSMELHLPDALIVEISEQSSNILSIEPESEIPDTEPESIISKPTPEISEPTPESELTPKTWTGGQLSVLKQWGGYDIETASDIDVLSKFGIKGEKIPAYVKDVTKWILNDQVSYEEFINLLQYLKGTGALSGDAENKSFQVNTQTEKEELIVESMPMDEKMPFEFDDAELNSKADFDDLKDKLRILRALGNNEIIQNELIKSNMEFETFADLNEIIDQRDSEWQRNPKTVTPFMESLMNNESALIAKTVIEHDEEDLIPLMSIVITNSYGVNVVITEKTPDYKQSDEQWWQTTKTNGANIMSGSSSEEYTSLYTAEISTVINDSKGNFMGIIKAVVNFEKALLLD